MGKIDTSVFELGRGNLVKVPEVFKSVFPGKKALIVADANTWKAAGEAVSMHMRDAGVDADVFLIPDREFHAEWKYIEMMDAEMDKRPGAVLVSVGSGTINDICKLCSHHHSQSYLTVPTAASVDGYTSFGASITKDNSKQTFDCPAPVAVVADVDVIAAAPKEMTAAGYADLAAKIPAGAEWMISDLFGTEPIVPDAWHILQDDLEKFLSRPEAVAAGDPDAIGDLFKGLVLSGFAMQLAQSSRPASCCDHLFSHLLDMTHHTFNGKSQSHGFQVAIGTLTMCAVFDEFLKYDLTKIDVDACVAAWPSLEQEQRRALEIFEGFPAPRLGWENLTRKYEPAEKVRKELEDIKAGWPGLKEKLRAQCWTFDRMQAMFKAAGAPYDPSMIGVTRQQLKDMFPKVQIMRWRINLLDLAKRARIYDTLVDSVFAPGGAWDLNAM